MLNFSYNILSMKIAIVIPVLLCCFLSAAAQQHPKTLLEIVKENKAEKIKQPILIPDKILLFAPKAKLLATTSKGKIYALPLDNMPCFVPDNNTLIAMPLKGWPVCGSNLMPNASKVTTIIPERTKGSMAFKDRFQKKYITPYSPAK